MPCSYDLGTQGCLFRLVLASPCLEKVNLGLSPLHCPHETAGTFLHLQPSPICALMSPKGEKGRFMCTGFEREWLSCAELHPCIEDGPIGPIFKNYVVKQRSFLHEQQKINGPRENQGEREENINRNRVANGFTVNTHVLGNKYQQSDA